MKAWLLFRLTRCPAFGRALLLLLLGAGLAACASYYPEPVQGLSEDKAWFALPLRRWLAEDRAVPEAIAVCRPPDCGPGIMVGIVRTRGRDAADGEGVLHHPDRLVQALTGTRDRKTDRSKVRTVATAKSLVEGPLAGFALAMNREDGQRPVFAAALGRRTGDSLTWVLAIGEDAGAVEATARRVAARHLGS